MDEVQSFNIQAAAGSWHTTALESRIGGLAHARLDAGDAAQLAAEADFADEGGLGGDLARVEAGGDCGGDAEIDGGLVEGEAPGDVDVDILVAEGEADALGENGEQHQHAVLVEAVGGAARGAEAGGGGEGLHLDEQGARALHADDDGGAAVLAARSARKSADGFGNIDHAFAAHLEDADLMGGAEAVFGAAQQAVGMEALAFEVEHGVDDMLQGAGAGDGALLW